MHEKDDIGVRIVETPASPRIPLWGKLSLAAGIWPDLDGGGSSNRTGIDAGGERDLGANAASLPNENEDFFR
jgi:hypothetical protein